MKLINLDKINFVVSGLMAFQKKQNVYDLMTHLDLSLYKF